MATVSSLGIGSGLDLSSIVTGLVDAERVPTENRLAFQEQVATTKLSAFGALKSSLSLFQGSLSSLQSTASYNSKSIISSDSSLFTASTTTNADIGSYSVEVSALATKHSLATNAATAFDSVDDTIGTGLLTIKFGTTSTGPYAFTQDTTKATQAITLSADNNNTTLSGLRDYINTNDYGVQAAIVNDGSGYRLTMTSESSGAANSMEITVSGDADGNNNDNAGLSQLAFNASAQTGVIQTVVAQDAALKINGLDITRDSNTVIGAIDGVTLNLLKADAGNAVSVNISENNSAVKSGVEGFVDSYNGLMQTINALTSYDVETTAAGLLIGDFTVRSISGQLRNLISNPVAQLNENIQSLVDIGIKTLADGSLELDSAKLDVALSAYPSEVEGLFALQGRPNDAGISYTQATDDTVAGKYAVNITTLASQGVYNATTLNSLIIDANNDNFTIKVDGITSDSISLTQATYADGASLASHIQAQINDDTNLKNSGISVVVSYDSLNNKLDITSARYGSASSIEFTAVDPNSISELGFSVASGTTGVDVAGTINGLGARGNGQTLSSSGGDSKGLALQVASGTIGDRGFVSFSRGVATTINSLLDNFLETDGFINNRENGLKKSLEEVAEARTTLNLRMETLEARLVAQFSALDALLAQFQSTSSFLTDQLNSLVEPNSISRN